MKVLFVYNRFENIGIEVLSSVLKENSHEVRLAFDPQLFNDGYLNVPFLARKYDHTKHILNQIRGYRPDVICFSVITDNYQWALRLARIIKKQFKIPIIFGGIHMTSVPEEVMSNDCVDYGIVGEGEYALLELLDNLNKANNLPKIKNLVYRKKGKTHQNKLRDLVKDLDALPQPDKELFYNRIPFLKNTYTLMTGRGCPFSCTYCFNNDYRRLYLGKGKYLRKRSVDNVIQELKAAKRKYNFKFLSILDDVFMTDSAWVEEFCKRYSNEINTPFRCIGHVNYINESNIKMLKNAGCEIIQIGIQTTCNYTRKNIIHRYEDNETIKNAAAIIKKNKIKFEIDHIIGFPFEKENEQIEAAKFYNEIRPDIINVYWLKCFPRTDIIKSMIEDGKLTYNDIKRIERGLEESYISGGSVKNVGKMKSIFSLFNLIPLLPPSIINFVINHKLYYFTNFGKTFMVGIRSIKGIFLKDIRLMEFISFYRHYMK